MGIKLASKRTCTGCMACVDACHHKALSPHMANDGHLYVKYNPVLCVNCKLCEKKCPVINQFNYKPANPSSHPYAAWAKDEGLRMKSASGGAFAAFATYILQIGGVVIGVKLENNRAFHTIIGSQEELSALQSSKYLQSHTAGIYQKTLDILQTKRPVLFSGTACQIAGLLSFLGNREFGNLYTADLICGGIPSYLLVEKFLEIEKDATEIKSYRDKIQGWGANSVAISVYTKTGRIVRNPSEEKLLLKGFTGGGTNRYSCYNCRFTGLQRKADVTLADFWGDQDYPEEHFKGISFITTHTPKGEELLHQSPITVHPTTWKKSIVSNPRMIRGKVSFAAWRPERIFISPIFRQLSYKMLRRIYLGELNTGLFYPYKILRYLFWKINTYHNKASVNRTLNQQK